MKQFILLVFGIIIIGLFGLFGVRFLTGEDTWICDNNQWVKHGSPSAPMPEKPCGKVVSPSPGSTDSPQASVESANIVVDSPKPNEEVGLPLVITGTARVFEGTFNYRLTDSDGTVLIERSAMTTPVTGDMAEFRPFEVSVNYNQPKGETGLIEVFQYSAKDGSQIDTVSVPVKFKSVESMTVKVFYSNTVKDPGAMECNKVFSSERRILKTQAPARIALEEMLLGPTVKEMGQGFITSINQGVKIQKLVIENGTASVDFDETLELAVGGSCRVAAIRAQITETLKQFSTVKKVVISINGRTEDILQP